jgi:site-specific DNA-methyltransferase (adenine-specific)
MMETELTLQRMLNAVHHGDCVVGMNSLPAGCVDLVFADPPFNIGYEYDVYDDTRDREHYLRWSRDWIAAVHRVLKPTGTFWLAIGDEYAAELKILSQEIGFHCRSWVVWYYTFGVNCTKKFTRSHAHLFHFVKNAARFTFRGDELENRIPSARQLVYNDNRANPSGRLPDDTYILRPQDMVDCLTPGEDTWYFPRVAGTFKERAGFHGCQMPEQLLGRIIRLCSHENEAVLDPFAGSATTLVVAKKMGRCFLGFEVSEEYVRRGSDRLDGVRRGDPLDGAAEPLVSAPPTPRGHGRSPSTTSSSRAKGVARASASPVLNCAAESMLERGLVEAFRRVSDGYSLDRVVVDPLLNQRLAEECRRLGLPGDPRSWNWRLFNYRKRGKLADIRTEKRTEFSWASCDEYLFASEIALAQMLRNGCESLDEILCDPRLAEEFDQIAQRFAGGFTALQYRWAALKLRKEAKFARARACALAPMRLKKAVPVSEIDWHLVPETAGLYLVKGGSRENIYVGETLRLRDQLRRQFGDPEALDVWQQQAATTDLCICTQAAEPSPPELLAYESKLIRQHKFPLLNFQELGAA